MATRLPKSKHRIVIRISDQHDLAKYQKGLMGLLHRISVQECDLELAENLKSVYDLLTLLLQSDSVMHTRSFKKKIKD